MPKKREKKKSFKKSSFAPRGKDQKSTTGPKEPGPANKFSWLQPPNEQWLGWICFGGIILLAFLMSFHTLTDTDIFWHLKTGQIIWQTHQVPDKDIYSFTMAGKEWIDAQWLFQLIIYALYWIYGFGGMILFGSGLTALTWLIVLKTGFNRKKYLSLSLLILISLLTASARLKLRPEILSFFYLALEIYLLDQYQRGKKSTLILLPILLLLWINSEGLWPIYFVIGSAFLGEEILYLPQLKIGRYFQRIFPASTNSSVLWLAISLACSLPVAFVNPYGWRGVIFPWILFQEVSFPGSFIGQFIGDLQSPFVIFSWFDFDQVSYITLIIFSSLTTLLLILRRQIYPATLLLWAGFLYLSLTAMRNVSLFALITAGLLGRIIRENQGPSLLPFPSPFHRLIKFRPWAAIVLLLFIFCLGFDLATSRFFLRNKSYLRFGIGALETTYPLRAAQFLKSCFQELGGRVQLRIFSDLDAGGCLIWYGYPDWKVYIDPRLEVYGNDFIRDFASLFPDPKKFEQADQKYDFDAVFLAGPIKAANFISNLYHDPNWSLVYLDGRTVIFLKNPGRPEDRPFLAKAVREHKIDFSKGYQAPEPAGETGPWLAREKFNLGFILYYYLDEKQLAFREWTESLRLNPDDPYVNYHLGYAYMKMLRHQKALPYLERTKKIMPGFLENRILLARAYHMTGDSSRSISEFRYVLKKDPDQIQACMDLGMVYEKARPELAYEQWKRCQEIYQSDPSLYQDAAEQIIQAFGRLSRSKQ